MKILIVGFLKTGTKSMCQALRILGYNVSEHGRNFEELYEDWMEFLQGKGNFEDLRKMFRGYDATSDTLVLAYWKEFLKAFPDIKLILTIRDDKYECAKSFINQYTKYNESAFSFPLSVFSLKARRWWDLERDSVAKFCKPPFEIKGYEICKKIPILDQDQYAKYYEDHNNDVLENAPRDQLLIFNVKEGWDPVCQFLGHELPDVPFPHENKNGSTTAHRLKHDSYVEEMYTEMYFTLALLALVITIVAAYLWY
uniref:uncharacterized protein LOC120331228 n=1 Tax=Styela clava TaxID=7725 RepID=UPI001939AE6D|nr:uncharacterized protein LOC120331228 [Styela clava]